MNTMSIEFKADNAALLDKAIEELGWTAEKSLDGQVLQVETNAAGGYESIEIDLRGGTAEVTRRGQDALNMLKRAYSRQTLQLACKQKGWIYKPVNTTIAGTTQEQVKGQILRY
jgi:hypothetical protein